jgi:hypothetical protein
MEKLIYPHMENYNRGKEMAENPQVQVQISEEMRTELEEALEIVKSFFDEKGIKYNVSEIEQDEDGSIYVNIDFDERPDFSEEQFDDFVGYLKDNLGLCNFNGAENQIANYLEFKEWLVFEEFGGCDPDNNVRVHLAYYEAQMKGETTIYLDGLTVEVKAPYDEDGTEEEEYEESEEGN